MKTVAIVQSSYIPWRGFFDIINCVDEFILYDDVQFTKRDWRSRNIIKTAQGLKWLTIPVSVKGKYYQKINEVTVSDFEWAHYHWEIIRHNYCRAPYFNDYASIIGDAYKEAAQEKFLSRINFLFIKLMCDLLMLDTKITWSTDYKAFGTKTERLLTLCKATHANRYLSGPSAINYIDADLFDKNGIELAFMNYDHYRPYQQLYEGFSSNVTILDVLFNTGRDAFQYLKKVE